MTVLQKPVHNNIVMLLAAFRQGSSISFVYEDMEFSLQDTLLVHGDPWTVGRSNRNHQFGTVLKQVVLGVQHLHEHAAIAHGNICTANILINHHGHIKIANIGHSMLKQSRDFETDHQGLADTFQTLSCLPIGNKQYDMIYDLCRNGAFEIILKHDFVQQGSTQCLIPLVVRTRSLLNNYTQPFTPEMEGDWGVNSHVGRKFRPSKQILPLVLADQASKNDPGPDVAGVDQNLRSQSTLPVTSFAKRWMTLQR
ncbi:hypothetical protein BST61_g10847 [Cercospora zeina]